MIISYLWLLAGNMIEVFGGMIDKYFLNSLGIQVIVIMGIINSIMHFEKLLCKYGIYYFRMYADRDRAGLRLCIIISTIYSTCVLLVSKYIPYVFPIESIFVNQLVNGVRAWFIFGVCHETSIYLSHYMILNDKSKSYSKMLTLYYVGMIVLDIVAVIIFKSVELGLAATGICDLCFAVFLYFISGIRNTRYTKGDVKVILHDGWPLVVNRICSKTCQFLLNFFAVRLGTLQCAVIVLIRSGVENGQDAVNPVSTALIVKCRGEKPKFRELLLKSKTTIIISSIIGTVLSISYVLVTKGELDVTQIIIPTLIACTTGILFYEPYSIQEAVVQLSHHSYVLKHVGYFRLVLCLILCLVSYITKNMYPILLYSTITDPIVMCYSMLKQKQAEIEEGVNS